MHVFIEFPTNTAPITLNISHVEAIFVDPVHPETHTRIAMAASHGDCWYEVSLPYAKVFEGLQKALETPVVAYHG